MRQTHDPYQQKGGMLAHSPYDQTHSIHHGSITGHGNSVQSYSQPFIDPAAYYSRQNQQPMRYASPVPAQSRASYAGHPKSYHRHPNEYYPTKVATSRAHSPSPFYPQDSYTMPSTPPPHATSRPRVSDYTGSGEFTHRGYADMPNYSNYQRSPQQWQQPREYHPQQQQQQYPHRMMSGPLQPSRNQYMQFSGKFSITPDPGNYIEEEWQDVVARHSHRRSRQGQRQKSGYNAGPHYESPYATEAQYNHRRAPEAHMSKVHVGSGHSTLQDGSVLPSPRNSVLPDDFQLAYEETCREMDAMQNAFREALSVYGDEVGDIPVLEVEDQRVGTQYDTSTARPEVGSTIPFRNESMPLLPVDKNMQDSLNRSMFNGNVQQQSIPQRLPQSQQEALVASAAAYGQTSAPNLTLEMEQEYAAEQTANNAKVLEWLQRQMI